MSLIVAICFICFFIFSPRFRCVILHPFSTIYYVIKDTYKYVRFCRWREYKGYGKLSIFTGLFGKGKTLMLSKTVRIIIKKFDGKKVFDFKEKKWKIQHIHVVSNVHLKNINYIQLTNLSDMLLFADDKFNDGVSIWLFVVDEMSTQINSREYKTNFTTELLNILLTCRHYRFEIIGTAQRFAHVDALVRQVTSTANECNKLWRLCNVYYYNAWTVENTSDVTKIKPIKTKCFFIKDKDYESYDTTAVVENFKDNVANGNILTDKEILEYQSISEEKYNAIHLKKKYRKKINA